MTNWQLISAAAAGLVLLLLMLRCAVLNARKRLERDFARKLETVLQPKETVKVILPRRQGRVILTNKRVLFDTKEGFHAVPLKSIKRIRGETKEGKTTSVPEKMVRFTIKADKDHLISGKGEDFTIFAKQLSDIVKKQNQREKEKKTKKSP